MCCTLATDHLVAITVHCLYEAQHCLSSHVWLAHPNAHLVGGLYKVKVTGREPKGGPSRVPSITPIGWAQPCVHTHPLLSPTPAACKSETRGRRHSLCDLQLKLWLFTMVRIALAANADRHHVSLLPAPPKCLFKPTHCSANWITFHVKIDLLKQQRRWQIKAAATAEEPSVVGWGGIKGACMGRGDLPVSGCKPTLCAPSLPLALPSFLRDQPGLCEERRRWLLNGIPVAIGGFSANGNGHCAGNPRSPAQVGSCCRDAHFSSGGRHELPL